MELNPICSSKFRPGKPTEEAQVLVEFLNEIASSTSRNPLVSFEDLSIETEQGSAGSDDGDEEMAESNRSKFVWYLYVDMYCLNHDGNIQDACLIALLSALNDGKHITIMCSS